MMGVILNKKMNPVFLFLEFAALFIVTPLLLFVFASRMWIYMTIWGGGLYAFLSLRQMPGFSFHRLWYGRDWTAAERHFAFLRFLFLACLLTFLTLILVPERFLRFPLEHFPLWLAVMILYPPLSIVPQELFFRSFYFARYGNLFGEKRLGVLINGLLFGFAHIILNNWIAPTLVALGGLILAHSYQQHRSLKWAVIEHTLYGCWIFTVGIGWYFFTGNWRS